MIGSCGYHIAESCGIHVNCYIESCGSHAGCYYYISHIKSYYGRDLPQMGLVKSRKPST